ncbi:MAG TPA: hypothetical protein VGF58_13155 [Burkholderiales bacterium]
MSNPYSPPKASVADIGEPLLPRGLRVLRTLAIAGNLVLGSTPLLFFVYDAPVGVGVAGFSAVLLAVIAASIGALTSRIAERPMRWSALLLNAGVAALLGYALLFEDRGITRAVNLLFIVPAVLNLIAIEALRRARARPGPG